MYTVADFERDIQAIRPRTFDTYILPVFLMAYAYKSKGMRLSARRALFVAGVYSGYRSYAKYKKLVSNLAQNISLENLQLPNTNGESS